MKAKIHPKYVEAKVICACGNTFTTGSTKPELHVEVCAKCHPFFTGKQHILDIQGRVDRFNKRYATKKAAPATAEAAPPR
ncbi:MAG: 50S ribosomal protein L31 [Chloroflexi bacterium]|nr:MAG: 50S ribosomal protein L31 [Chloroflexi bacterium 13_1_40CM_2_70_6]OLE77434.1 MAG: 50S ribosomal protein L31 [Chloroflexi bacterium 13_1_20CM_2_70_9]TME95584.1 MAG: 50S ribosomal protein L31 [Chloroflexota bacterium]TMF64204.1 MAG: 50S ribosomal protein L31 [Chloroflexota bacterium]TMG34308.1 MAG: 50S ribosomal protein L31 [Chloroflexota bacterium]